MEEGDKKGDIHGASHSEEDIHGASHSEGISIEALSDFLIPFFQSEKSYFNKIPRDVNNIILSLIFYRPPPSLKVPDFKHCGKKFRCMFCEAYDIVSMSTFMFIKLFCQGKHTGPKLSGIDILSKYVCQNCEIKLKLQKKITHCLWCLDQDEIIHINSIIYPGKNYGIQNKRSLFLMLYEKIFSAADSSFDLLSGFVKTVALTSNTVPLSFAVFLLFYKIYLFSLLLRFPIGFLFLLGILSFILIRNKFNDAFNIFKKVTLLLKIIDYLPENRMEKIITFFNDKKFDTASSILHVLYVLAFSSSFFNTIFSFICLILTLFTHFIVLPLIIEKMFRKIILRRLSSFSELVRDDDEV